MKHIKAFGIASIGVLIWFVLALGLFKGAQWMMVKIF